MLEILQHAHQAATEQSIEYFVGGALARDILLHHVFGGAIERATLDVDIGVYLRDWEEFNKLRVRLIETGRFFALEGSPHRLHFARQGGVPLDLIPFGEVADEGQHIAWPPNRDVVLNVAGFEDAQQFAVPVDLGEGMRTRVCSLPSLAVLKLLAWKDRHTASRKDATDFLLIAQRYADAGNEDRLYEAEIEVLAKAEHDMELAGATLLGKDAAKTCRPATAQQVRAILSDTKLRQLMLDQLLRSKAMVEPEIGEGRIAAFLNAFERGFAS
ncbi:MAG: nucleotidyl transferase AbiEii/AbiGii toxin family protein [Acidovorax sp.]